MRIGLGAPVSGAWATPSNLGHVAARAEELGYDSLWTFQRLLIGVDEQLDAVYQSVLDPLLSLTYAAAHTSRIRLGVALVNLPFVSPVVLGVVRPGPRTGRLSGPYVSGWRSRA